MKRIKSLIVLFVCALVFVSCKSSKDKALTQESMNAVFKTHDLTGEEFQLLEGYVMRRTWSNTLAGKDSTHIFDSDITITQAVQNQRQWLHDDSVHSADLKRQAAEALANHDREIARFRDILTVTPIRKGFYAPENGFQSWNTFLMDAKNSGDKAIRGFKGSLIVNDMFGDKIASLEIKEDTVIQAGQDLLYPTAYYYNQFMDSDQKLKNTDIDKMKFVWNPEMIVFTDGSVLTVPDLQK